MIIKEIPFPIPRSVIRSPSHITKVVPAVNTITEVIVKATVLTIIACGAVAIRLIEKAIDWSAVIPTVPYLVNRVILRLPSSPSL